MAEIWARIAADRGAQIAVAPFSRRVSPRCITLLPALWACSLASLAPSSDWPGDGLVGPASSISDGDGRSTHMGGSGRVSRSSSPEPSPFAQDGVSAMHAAYSIGKPDGVWLGTSVSKRPWANARNMGAVPS